MRRNKRTAASDTGQTETGFPEVHAEIVRWEGGILADQEDDDPVPAYRHDGADLAIPQSPSATWRGEPKVVRVRRSVLLWLVCLIVIAALVIAGLVRYLPAHKTAASAAAKTSAQPTPSATQPSPAESATSGGPSTGASDAASPGATDGSSPGTSASPGDTTSAVAAAGGGAGAPLADLSALTPVTSNNVAGMSTGPQQIGATTYQDSVRFTCYPNSGNVIYDVANYKYLTTIIGIPSDASNGAGNAMTITFYKDGSASQLSTPVTVTLDHPQSVHLNLQGSSQLEISCSAINTTNQQAASMDVAFGNGTIGPS